MLAGAGAGVDLLAQAPKLSDATATARAAKILTSFTIFSPPSVAGSWGESAKSPGTDNKNHSKISTWVPSAIWSKIAMMSSLRMRTQPQLAGEPI
jgi:hypothetical protein